MNKINFILWSCWACNFVEIGIIGNLHLNPRWEKQEFESLCH
jgi:hypothetical protein